VVSRNFCPALNPYLGPRNSTNADHMLQIENPMCSEKIEKIRLRRATRLPDDSQNTSSSGRQSSIQWADRGWATTSSSGTVGVWTAVDQTVSGVTVMALPRLVA
jgi:hypothetical protein